MDEIETATEAGVEIYTRRETRGGTMILGGRAPNMTITGLRLRGSAILGRSVECIQRGVEGEGTVATFRAMRIIWQGRYIPQMRHELYSFPCSRREQRENIEADIWPPSPSAPFEEL